MLAGEAINPFVLARGDFNDDRQLDPSDIDALAAEVQTGTNRSAFDCNGDGAVNPEDQRFWVEVLRRTYFGDANLDGQFDTSDLVLVFQAGLYEDNVAGNASWASGDWNGDADFDTSDLVLAFQGGGFEQGLRPLSRPSVDLAPQFDSARSRINRPRFGW